LSRSALHSLSGEFITDPLSVFNSHPLLSPSSPPSLSFESRFESGNLARATQLSPSQYALHLSHDLNTNAHTQWFLFRVRGLQPGVSYRFDIVNLEKKTSAFTKGMRPCLYSEKEAQTSGLGWCRALLAHSVYYFPNHHRMEPRMSKHETAARTPTLALAHLLSLERSRRRAAQDGQQAQQAEESRPDYVDVEEAVERGMRKLELAGESAAAAGASHEQQLPQLHAAMRGEAGAMLASFLSSETPLDRSFSASALPDGSSASVPLTPRTGASSPVAANGPRLMRTLSSPVSTSAPPSPPQYHHTLSFKLSVVHEGDTVYLSHFYPYTFTFLRNRLQALQSRCSHLIRQPLAYTRIGNLCELLTITDTSAAAEQACPVRSRPVLFFTARVHPGESNASWALDGLLSFLCSSQPAAAHLRQLAVVKLVPMLNIDGVVEGNYRSNLSGLDLNRYWSRSNARDHPTIHAARQLLFELGRRGEPLLLFVDWHGHSSMSSTGLYGCNEKESSIRARDATEEERRKEAEEDWLDVVPPQSLHLRERLFPMLVSMRGCGLFDYSECTFNVSQYKAGSARVVVWQGLRLSGAYTLETSFRGADEGKTKGCHWNTEHYRKIGKVAPAAHTAQQRSAAADN
jgi:hypothetical protein